MLKQKRINVIFDDCLPEQFTFARKINGKIYRISEYTDSYYSLQDVCEVIAEINENEHIPYDQIILLKGAYIQTDFEDEDNAYNKYKDNLKKNKTIKEKQKQAVLNKLSKKERKVLGIK